ncbi:MAG TPA: HAD-IC family P-type ATPase [Thermoplasmata archaeon]|nr:HAD-IC family P-type ATPase [Thermoplasmata archaeon]
MAAGGEPGTTPPGGAAPTAPVLPPTPPGGLSAAEVDRRRARFGANEVPEQKPGTVRVLLRQMWGPVPWMIEAALVLEAALDQVPEAAILAGLLLLNAVLSTLQERRAQAAVDLLRQRLEVLARVLRDGVWKSCPARELVPGDRIHVRMGDIVPADAHVDEGSVEVDQSMLTGESTSVTHGPGDTLYSGSVVRRSEATATVTAIGATTYFGRTAELVRTAHAQSHLEDLMLKVVQYLLILDATLVVVFVGAGLARGVSLILLGPFVLILLIASVPVALPATFTVASSLESRHLADEGVLVTGLSAVEDAAGMDLLCSDKTGTLTQNRQTVTDVRSVDPGGDAELLALAAAACDPSTQDPIDLAILQAAAHGARPAYARSRIVPFEPATKRSEAWIDHGGVPWHVVLGQPAIIATLVQRPPGTDDWVERRGAEGFRLLAVGAGPEGALQWIGVLALEDPIRDDAPALLRRLDGLGIRVVMVTGDAASTARSVAKDLGLPGPIGTRDDLARASVAYSGFAGVYPEDKFGLVRTYQAAGRIVGMTGDGVNDAPALKQAEVGIAVASATDVAKASAKLVLTRPGLGGIVSAVESGRRVYRRMLTWMLNKISKTIEQVVLLSLAFVATGLFVTTPLLILLMIFANDFVVMSVGTDRARVSPSPDRWDVRRLVTVGGVMAAGWLCLSFSLVVVGTDVLRWPLATLQTVIFLDLVFSGQATLYLMRERGRFWASRPSNALWIATTIDLTVLGVLATFGVLMAPVSPWLVLGLLGLVAAVALVLDQLKLAVFRWTEIVAAPARSAPSP